MALYIKESNSVESITIPTSEYNKMKEQITQLNSDLNNKANTSQLNNYLPLSGGTLSGNLNAGNNTRTVATRFLAQNKFGQVSLEMSAAGNMGLYDMGAGTWIIRKNDTDEVFVESLSQITFKLGGAINISPETPTWLTLLSGSSGVNVKSYANSLNWMPISASSFNKQSSRKVKNNITPIKESEAQKILDVDVVKFDYIEEVGGQKDQFGVIAEDVEKIIPFAVTIPETYNENDPNIDDTPAVDYSKFVPYLIKMVQIQQDKINTLQKQININ